MCHSRRHSDFYIDNAPHPTLLNLEDQIVNNYIASENPIIQIFFGFCIVTLLHLWLCYLLYKLYE